MAGPVAALGALSAKQVEAQFFDEYINGNTFAPFMGGQMDVVDVDTVEKGKGDITYVSLLGAFDPSKRVTGNGQAQGNGEAQNAFSFAITLDLIRKPVKLENVDTTAQRTPLPFMEKLRPNLLDCTQQMLRNDLIDLTAYATGGSSPLQWRALFGAGESNYNATLNTALANIDATGDKLTMSHIRMLRRKAMANTFSTTAIRKIRPTKMTTDNGVPDEYFIMLVDPRAYFDLQNDSQFQALATQGKFEDMAPSYVRGSRFRGMIDNVMIFEEPELARVGYLTAGNGTSPVCHNLFMGAQAFGLRFGNVRTELDEEWTDFKNIYELCHKQIRGQGMVTFSDALGNTYENGIIHSFTTGANAS